MLVLFTEIQVRIWYLPVTGHLCQLLPTTSSEAPQRGNPGLKGIFMRKKEKNGTSCHNEVTAEIRDQDLGLGIRQGHVSRF